MADGTVRINFQANVDDVKRGSRDAIRELGRVNKAADQSSSAQVKSSGKVVGGLTRIISTGKVSAKSLDKIGRSASTLLSGLSPIGVGLGLGAVPLLSDGVVAAISAIREANKSLTTRINEAAAAQRSFTAAQLASTGSTDAVTLAQMSLADATLRLSEARKTGKASGADITRLEIAERGASIDLAVATNSAADARKTAGDAAKKYSAHVQDVINKSLHLTSATQSGRAAILDQAGSVKTVVAALRKNASAAKDLTEDRRAAQRSLADYIEQTGKVPDDVKTKVLTPGMNPALARMSALQAKANALDGRQIRITTILDTITETHRQGLATGGRIAGRFTGKDDIPINVSAGEVVLNPRQQKMVDGGASIGQALRGAPVVRAGGSFAKGGRSDRSMDQFLGGSVLDRLALAASTLDEKDDRSAAGLARDKISRILKSGKLGRRRLSRSERRMLLEALGGYRRDALAPDLGGGGGGVGTGVAANVDPFALSRAEQAGFQSGRGRLEGYVFGGSGDIGTGGASALGAAGSIPMLHVENLSFANSPQNQGQIASAGNTGNALLNRGRIYQPRTGVSF